MGKAGQCAEAELCGRYMERAGRVGRQIGITDVTVREIADMTGPNHAAAEGEKMLAARRTGPLVVMDERGEGWTSVELACRLAGWQEAGTTNLTFAIGGADGHADAVRSAADRVLSLGPMTLPHLLARAVLLEQLYRAVTIRLGHPYHRA